MQRSRTRSRGPLLRGLLALAAAVAVAGLLGMLFSSSSGLDALDGDRATVHAKEDERAGTVAAAAELAETDADATARAAAAEVAAAPPPEDAEDAIPPDATGFSGRIIGRDGKPAAGAKVVARRDVLPREAAKFGVTVPPGEESAPFEVAAESDAEGRFVVPGLVPDPAYVLFASDGKGNLARKYRVEALAKAVLELGDLPLRTGALVSGLLRTENGGKVAGAKVFVDRWSGEPVVSDADGRFDAGVVFPGKYQITVQAPGFALADTLEQEFVEGDVIDDLRIVLVPAAPIRGWLRDQHGRPVAGAWISASRSEQEGFAGWYGDSVRTVQDGGFALEWLAPGTYDVSASAPGYEDTSRGEVVAGGPPIDLSIQKSGSIEGLVIDARTGAGVEASGVQVSWIPPWNDDPNAEYEDYWYDIEPDLRADGRFTIHVSEVGRMRVEAWADGYTRAASAPFELTSGNTASNVVVRLEPADSLSVTALDTRDRAPVKGAIVLLVTPKEEQGAQGQTFFVSNGRMMHGGGGGRQIARAVSDADGVAQLHSLPAGRYTVRVRHPGFATGEVKEVEVVRGETPAPLEVLLAQGGAIEGRVTNDQGEAETAMKVIAVGSEDEVREGVSLEEGRYRVEHLAPGRYRVEARPEGGMYATNKGPRDGREVPEAERFPLVVEEGRTVAFDVVVEKIEPGTLVGNVTINGAPAANVSVMASFRDPSSRGNHMSWSWNNRTETDALGNFRFRRLKPGTYALTVHQGWRKSFAGALAQVNAKAETQVAISIALGAITGRIVDPDGNAIEGATVSAQAQAQPGAILPWNQAQSATTGPDGMFTITELQAGTYAVDVSARGFESQKVDGVEVPPMRAAAPLDLRLAPGGWLKIRIVNPIVEGYYMIAFRAEDGSAEWSRWEGAGDDGTCWVENTSASPGTLTVTTVSWDGTPPRSGTTTIAPAKGQVLELSLELQ